MTDPDNFLDPEPEPLFFTAVLKHGRQFAEEREQFLLYT